MNERFIIYSDGFSVKKTETVPNDGFDIYNKKYTNYFIFQDLFYTQREKVFKKGDSIPLELDGLKFLKAKGKIVKKKFNRDFGSEDTKLKKQELLENFFRNINKEKVLELKSICESIDKDEDVVYRGIYNSLKMYRIREEVAQVAKLQIELVSGRKLNLESPKEIVSAYKDMFFNSKMQSLLEKTLLTFFNMGKNEQDAWVEDMQILYSSLKLFCDTSKFLVKICEDLENKTGFLFTGNSILAFYEAGAMQLWCPLGDLRSKSTQENKITMEKFYLGK